jgi:hypothetical protein
MMPVKTAQGAGFEPGVAMSGVVAAAQYGAAASVHGREASATNRASAVGGAAARSSASASGRCVQCVREASAACPSPARASGCRRWFSTARHHLAGALEGDASAASGSRGSVSASNLAGARRPEREEKPAAPSRCCSTGLTPMMSGEGERTRAVEQAGARVVASL